MSITPSYQGELLFRRWSDSSTQGTQVVFALADRSELEAFIGREGRRYAAVLIELTDTEEPATQEPVKLGPICREAVDLCRNPAFLEWLAADDEKRCTEAEAREWILEKCWVNSRKELDTNREAQSCFVQHVRTPFLRWQRERKQG